MPPLRNGRATNRTNRTQAEHDIMEGLPVRQWRKQFSVINMSAPKEVSEEAQKQQNTIWRELPMPAGSELYAPMAQELLRRARMLYREPTSANGDDSRAGADDKKDSEPDAQYAKFSTLRWSQLPKDQEEPEREFLAKRRKGLPSIHAVQDTALRRATVKQTTETGEVKFLEVMVPQGISIQTEVSENDAVAAGSVIEKAAPGAVIEGLGVVANNDGVVLVNEAMVVPQKRKFVPRKKKGPGRGRKKWKAAAVAPAAAKAAEAASAEAPTLGTPGEIKTEEGGEKPDVEVAGATNPQDQEGDGEEGSENDDENDDGEEGDEGDEEDEENENEEGGNETGVSPEKQDISEPVAAQQPPTSLPADSTDPLHESRPIDVASDNMVVDDQAINDEGDAEAEGEDDAAEDQNPIVQAEPQPVQQVEEIIPTGHVHPSAETPIAEAETANDEPAVVDEASSSLQALNETDSLPNPVEQFQPMDEEIKPVDETSAIEEETVIGIQTVEPQDEGLPDVLHAQQEPESTIQNADVEHEGPIAVDVEMTDLDVDPEAPLQDETILSEEQPQSNTDMNLGEPQEAPEPESTILPEIMPEPLVDAEPLPAEEDLLQSTETSTLETDLPHVHPISADIIPSIQEPEEPSQPIEEQQEIKPVSDEEILLSAAPDQSSLPTEEQPQDDASTEIQQPEVQPTFEPEPASEPILEPETSTIQNTTIPEPVPLTSEQQTDSPQAQTPLHAQAELNPPSPSSSAIPHVHPRPKLSVSFKTPDHYESVSTPERPEMSPITVGQQSTPSLDTNPRPRLGISTYDRESTSTPERPAISPITIAGLDEQDFIDRTGEDGGAGSQLDQDPLDLNQPVTHLPSPPPPPEPTAATLPHPDAGEAVSNEVLIEQTPVAVSSTNVIPPPMPLEPSTEAEGPTDEIPPGGLISEQSQ